MKLFNSIWAVIVAIASKIARFIKWVFMSDADRAAPPSEPFKLTEIKRWEGTAEDYLKLLNAGQLDDWTDYVIHDKPWDKTLRTLGGHISLPLEAVLVLADDGRIIIENAYFDEESGEIRSLPAAPAEAEPAVEVDVDADMTAPVMFTSPPKPKRSRKPAPKTKRKAAKRSKPRSEQ